MQKKQNKTQTHSSSGVYWADLLFSLQRWHGQRFPTHSLPCLLAPPLLHRRQHTGPCSLQVRLPLLQNTDDKINYIEHRDNKTPKLITSQLFYCVLQLSMLSTYINVPIRCLVTKVTVQNQASKHYKASFFLGVRKSQLLDIY